MEDCWSVSSFRLFVEEATPLTLLRPCFSSRITSLSKTSNLGIRIRSELERFSAVLNKYTCNKPNYNSKNKHHNIKVELVCRFP